MGLELILLTHAVGLVLLCYGASVLVVGRISLSVRNSTPIRGLEARAWGILCILLALIWFLTVTWAWGEFARA
ncbi:hypothetical protein [Tautonia marina]|uniref:hypothetical protein n=1 Tax=Tautonia marina TaxID=2653855 RepID=UPI001260B9F7|nr:hypothetical protein [Tautonia marina]